jgi:hypothetical protein
MPINKKTDTFSNDMSVNNGGSLPQNCLYTKLYDSRRYEDKKLETKKRGKQ